MAFWSWVQSEDTEEISGILSKTTKEDKIPDETKKDILWFYKNSVEIETLYTFYNRIKEQLENSNFPFKEYITVPEIILKMVKRKEIMLAFSKSYFVIILKNKEEGSNLEDNVEEISYNDIKVRNRYYATCSVCGKEISDDCLEKVKVKLVHRHWIKKGGKLICPTCQ